MAEQEQEVLTQAQAIEAYRQRNQTAKKKQAANSFFVWEDTPEEKKRIMQNSKDHHSHFHPRLEQFLATTAETEQEEPSEEAKDPSPTLDTSELPEELSSLIAQLLTSLEEGNLDQAAQGLVQIEKHFSENSEQFTIDSPPNLCFEHQLYLRKNTFYTDQKPKLKKLEVICSEEPNSLLKKSYREVNRLKKASAQIRESRQGAVEISGVRYRTSAQAALQSLACQQIRVPIFVEGADKCESALWVLATIIMMGSFVLLDPVTPGSHVELSAQFKHAIRLQNILSRRNNLFPAQTMLHLLAFQGKLSEIDTSLLDMFILAESMMSKSLTQMNADNRSPLCEAILHGNIDFIRYVLKSNAAKQLPWKQLIDLESTQMLKAINKQFTMPSLREFDQKSYPQTERLQFQLDLINELQRALNERVDSGNESIADLQYSGNLLFTHQSQTIRQWLNVQQCLQWFLNVNGKKDKCEISVDNETSKTLQTMHLASKSKNSSLAIKKTNDKSKLLSNLFMHPCLKSGMLVHQMCLTMDQNQLQSLIANPETDFKQILFSQVVPLATFIPTEQKNLPQGGQFQYQERTQSTWGKNIADKFYRNHFFDYIAFAEQKVCHGQSPVSPLIATSQKENFAPNYLPSHIQTYSYSLKLAIVYRPDDAELHNLILDRMDVNSFSPVMKLEILCLLAQVKGCQNAVFRQLFDAKAWLLGLKEGSLRDINFRSKITKGIYINYVIKEYSKACLNEVKGTYSDAEEAFTYLILQLGKALIKNHEADLFEQFFYSIRTFFCTQNMVTVFIHECLAHFSPECLVPIFVLCNEDFRYRSRGSFSRPYLDRMAESEGKDTTKITLEQIQTTEALKISFQKLDHVTKGSRRRGRPDKGSKIALTEFLKHAPTRLVDKCVEQILENDLVFYHCKFPLNIQSKNNFNGEIEDQKQKKTIEELNFYQLLTKTVILNSSIQTSTKFIQYLFNQSKRFDQKETLGEPRFGSFTLLYTLFMFFTGQTRDDNVFDVKKTKHMSHHRRQMAMIFKKHVAQALVCPKQLEFIRQSMSDSEMAQMACDWIGIEKNVYEETCRNALAHLDKRSAFVAKSYFKWEIGQSNSAAPGNFNVCSGEEEQKAGSSKIKVYASRGSSQPTSNFFQELVIMQKYEQAKGMMQDLINGLKDTELEPLSKFIFNPRQEKHIAQDENTDKRIYLPSFLQEHIVRYAGQNTAVPKSILMTKSLIVSFFERILPLYQQEGKQGMKKETNVQIVERFMGFFLSKNTFTYSAQKQIQEFESMKPYYVKALNELYAELANLISADISNFEMFMTFQSKFFPQTVNENEGEHEDEEEIEQTNEKDFLFDLLKQAKDALKKAPLSSQMLEDRFKIVPIYTYFVSPCLKLFFYELAQNIDSEEEKESKVLKMAAQFVLLALPEEQLQPLLNATNLKDYLDQETLYCLVDTKYRTNSFKALIILKYRENQGQDSESFQDVIKHIIKKQTFRSELKNAVRGSTFFQKEWLDDKSKYDLIVVLLWKICAGTFDQEHFAQEIQSSLDAVPANEKYEESRPVITSNNWAKDSQDDGERGPAALEIDNIDNEEQKTVTIEIDPVATRAKSGGQTDSEEDSGTERDENKQTKKDKKAKKEKKTKKEKPEKKVKEDKTKEKDRVENITQPTPDVADTKEDLKTVEVVGPKKTSCCTIF